MRECWRNLWKWVTLVSSEKTQKLILAHRVLKIALMNSFVLCQPTNAAARRLCRRLCRPPHRHLSQVCIMFANRPFYRYGCHIEFIRFKEYYGMPRGHSLSIYARFWGKKRSSLYISREKGDHYYIQTRHNDLFFPLQSSSRKTYRKIGPKSAR